MLKKTMMTLMAICFLGMCAAQATAGPRHGNGSGNIQADVKDTERSLARR